MVFDSLLNFAYGNVLGAPIPPGSGGLITLAAGQGANFPAPPFNIVVWPAGVIPLAANAEVMRVTVVNGDQLTITRRQEGSNARAVVSGDQVSAAITAKTLTDMQTAINAGGGTTPFAAAPGSQPPALGTTNGQLAWNTATNEIWGWTGAAWQAIIAV